ncbi:MAG: hypothetical protein A2508_04030 [Candidatus Lambdaproteobacteria bacterium RIFOXYD12_FULL_49_8]|nr:MAG: hypothetical protein A2508_04030 [Candidatus Lambdaproteobacteria bacterium RIFOXYD12_FULL_49_8]
MNGLKLIEVAKSFGEVEVLKPASLDLGAGQFLVLVGPSGCGKTTLLRLIAGLEEASGGQIFIDNQEVTHLEPSRRGVAMVFQNYALYPHMTVKGNLEYPLKIAKLATAQRQAKIAEVAQILEIEPLLNRKPAQLSGGQRQRVAIGRALVREPKIFLFDEPLSNLDARLREQMRQEIAQLHRRLGKTSVYVTHDQAEAMTLADQLAVVSSGRILQMGPPLELYKNPNCLFVAQFLGHPPLTLIEGTGSGALFKAGFGQLEFKSRQFNGPVTLGIRPEASQLGPGPSLNFQGEIAFFEHLGREAHVELDLGAGQRLRLVVPDQPLSAGQSLRVSVNEEKILCFDPKTGARIP